MRLKTELYEKEQYQIIDTIIDILDLAFTPTYGRDDCHYTHKKTT